MTLAAELSVAPLLSGGDGAATLVSLPANILAVPVAGPLMAWGLVAGAPAGWLAEHGATGPAMVLHLPTRVGVGWVGAVARVAAAVPAAKIPLPALLAAAAGILLGAAGPQRRGGADRGRWRRVAVAALVAPALVAGLGPRTDPVAGRAAQFGALRMFGVGDGPAPLPAVRAVALLDGRVEAGDVLAADRAGVGAAGPAWLVVTSSSGAARRALAAWCARWPAALVLVPAAEEPGPDGASPAWPDCRGEIRVVSVATLLELGDLVIRLTPNRSGQGLAAAVERGRGDG